jgi:SAM-dependent methyltransferase
MKNPDILRKQAANDTAGACSVCGASSTRHLENVSGCDYRRCDHCLATLMDPAQWLSSEAEYARYLEHENSSSDTGYRTFLAKLADPLLKKLDSGRKGLDYGCGPGPVLARMLSESGHRVSLYDPYFFPNRALLDNQYDFITCSETIEHFHRPATEFAGFDRMLRPGGWLAIMTCFQTDDALFASWHYRRDPTHVVFYREATLRHIAKSFGWSCEIPVKDVALIQKPLNR